MKQYNGFTKEKTRSLRKEGYSYEEISKKLGVAKSTISLWCRDILLTPAQIQRLIEHSHSNWQYAIENRKRKKQERIKAIIENAIKEIKKLNKKELKLVGTALYWAEGDKKQDRVSLSNSDYKMIALMMRFFREICKIPEDRFRARLYIHIQEMHHLNRSEDEAKTFWSRLTGIPKSQFQKTGFYLNKKTNYKRGKIMEWGVLTISAAVTDIAAKAKGLVEGLRNQY